MMEVQEAMWLKSQETINQPCYGCIHFDKCGEVTNSAPFNCNDRITVAEYGHIPTKEERMKIY